MTTKRWLFVIFAIGLILRVAQIAAAPFWYDEAFTAILARSPLPILIDATAGDTHPPLYYLLAWSWGQLFGVSELGLRSLSLVLSMVCLWLTWLVTGRFQLSETTRIVIVALMAAMPMQIHYAQEARMYSLFTGLVLLAVYLVKRRSWFALGIVNLALLYTHNYALFYLPVIGLIATHGEMKRPLHLRMDNYTQALYRPPYDDPRDQAQTRYMVLAYIVPVFLWLPWAWILIEQMQTVARGYWIQPVTPGAVIYSVYMLLLSFGTPDKLQVVSVMVAIGLTLLAVYRGLRDKRLNLLMLAFGPLVIAVVGSLLWKPVLLFRGLSPSAPFLYMLIAVMIGDSKISRLLLAVFLAPMITAGVVGHLLYNADNKGEEVSQAIQYVSDNWQEGDALYHISDGSAVVWSYYLPGVVHYELPTTDTCGQGDPGSLSVKTRAAIGIQPVQFEQVEAGRAWLIYSVHPLSIACGVDMAESLRDRSTEIVVIEQNSMVETGVYLYENLAAK